MAVQSGTCGYMSRLDLYLHFLNSKGAYADAQTHYLGLQPNSTCGSLNGGEPFCLKYTGDCASCPTDPAAQPGELSCWCTPPNSVALASLASGKLEHSYMELQVDKDLDGTDDYRVSGGYVRGYEAFSEIFRVEWEDLYAPPNGDFNDFVSAVEARECTSDYWPIQLALSESSSIACVDPCADNACDAVDITESEQRFGAGVGIDRDPQLSDGQDREPPGRLIDVTIAGYYTTPGRRIAVCPALRLKWPRPRSAGESKDLTTDARYGGPACQAGQGTESPECYTEHLDADVLTISLARSQTFKPQCGAQSGPDDSFVTPSRDSCLRGSYIQSYQIPIAEIDGQLSDPTLHFGAFTADQFRIDLIDSVDVIVFELQGTGPFYCPSGVNVEFDSADPNVATAYRHRLTPPFRLWTYERL